MAEIAKWSKFDTVTQHRYFISWISLVQQTVEAIFLLLLRLYFQTKEIYTNNFQDLILNFQCTIIVWTDLLSPNFKG